VLVSAYWKAVKFIWVYILDIWKCLAHDFVLVVMKKPRAIKRARKATRAGKQNVAPTLIPRAVPGLKTLTDLLSEWKSLACYRIDMPNTFTSPFLKIVLEHPLRSSLR
jgi:hypothetical protein